MSSSGRVTDDTGAEDAELAPPTDEAADLGPRPEKRARVEVGEESGALAADEEPPPPPTGSPPVVAASHNTTDTPSHKPGEGEQQQAWGGYTEDNPPPPPPGSPPKGPPKIEVVPALQRITAHIRTPAKLGKAVALVQKLLDSGSCEPAHVGLLLKVVDASLLNHKYAMEPTAHREYRRLFKSLDQHLQLFDGRQRKHMEVYRLLAITRNALVSTDDSFMFNKLIGEVKALLRGCPDVDPDYGDEVLLSLKEQMQELQANGYKSGESDLDERGLQAWDSEEVDSMMKEAILDCLDATKNHCYAKQWARTSIDLALLDACEQSSKFAKSQQLRLKAFKVFVTEQRAKRKQGLSAKDSGSYTTSYEQARATWSTSKVSHRGNVGGGGDHKTETWLG